MLDEGLVRVARLFFLPDGSFDIDDTECTKCRVAKTSETTPGTIPAL
jgi:hypothetical protein